MSLKTIAGKLLRTATNKLALFCECCLRYCCVNTGAADECGNFEKECVPCPGGPKPNCVVPCPPRPPCILQCVEVDQTPCEDPIYDCVHNTEVIGIPVESCEECPETPPCEDEYYCCYEFEPSGDPESPMPEQFCQLGPCESPGLTASGPYISENACEALCKNYYCCYEYEPSENPELPLPPTFCQEGPCADPALQAGGPYATLAQCSCQCCKKTICHERVCGTYNVLLASFDPLTNPCQPDPVNDLAPGTVAIDWGNLACNRQANSQYCTNDWGARCGGLPADLDIGDTAAFNQYYERFRAVDNCDDCIDTGGAFCNPGVDLLNCFAWEAAPVWLQQLVCSCAAAENFCDNPLP